MPPVAVLLLAAGGSSRMRGADKLLEPVGGQPLLARLARAALASGGPVVVTLPAEAGARRDALAGLGVAQVPVPDASEGMAASIRAGVAALPRGTPAVMILPTDMPELTADDLATVLAAWHAGDGARPLRASAADGTPGHPVVFPAALFDALRGLSGDAGARDLLRRTGWNGVPLPARHAVTDLDTPEDWEAWRRGGG